jgi:ribosome biogenesis protein MAK21
MKASMPKELDVSDDEDSIPSGLDEDDDDSLAGLQDSEGSVDNVEEPSEVDEDDDDKLSLVESSDAEDLIPLDEAEALAFNDGLIDWPGGEGGSSDDENEEDEEWTGTGGGSPTLGEKRKRKGGKEGQKKRKKVRSLPTFASYEDYAKLIEEGPEDDI